MVEGAQMYLSNENKRELKQSLDREGQEGVCCRFWYLRNMWCICASWVSALQSAREEAALIQHLNWRGTKDGQRFDVDGMSRTHMGQYELQWWTQRLRTRLQGCIAFPGGILEIELGRGIIAVPWSREMCTETGMQIKGVGKKRLVSRWWGSRRRWRTSTIIWASYVF